MNKKGKENKQLLLPKYHQKPLPPSPFNNEKGDIIKMDRVQQNRQEYVLNKDSQINVQGSNNKLTLMNNDKHKQKGCIGYYSLSCGIILTDITLNSCGLIFALVNCI